MTVFLFTTAATVLAQADAAGGGAADAGSSVAVTSVLDFIMKGGFMMIPIVACSLVALTVFIERAVSLRRRRVIPPDFAAGLAGAMEKGADDRSAAIAYCERDGSPLADICLAAVKRLHMPADHVEKQVAEAGEREVMKLRRFLRVLAVIAAIAPLMGLLGTIFGMINAFQTVALSGDALGKTELLARGIYEALITTAAGLSLTIPTLIAYHWLSSRIDGLLLEMDLIVSDVLEAHLVRDEASADKSADGDAASFRFAESESA